MVILSQNKSDKEFFIGMSKNEYYKYIKPIKKEPVYDMCMESNIDIEAQHRKEMKDIIVEFYNYPEIFEMYVVVNKDLSSAFIATATYPYSSMWNGYSPWQVFTPTKITDIKQISNIDFSDYYVYLGDRDITEFDGDCIVNAANTELRAGGGVCGAIFKKAGYKELQDECNFLAPIKTGEAVLTKGYNLKANFIIHTAGPIYRGPASAKYLKASYLNSLKLADEKGLKSIAFPSISTGIYGYPKEEAAKIALDVVLNYKPRNLKEVFLICFDKETLDIYRRNYLIILTPQPSVEDAIKGSLIGGAIGDALGGPIEFMSFRDIINKYGENGITSYELEDGLARITDDTQMTLFTANGILFGDTRGKLRGVQGEPSDYIYYMYLDWLVTQGVSKKKEKHSWLTDIPELNVRRAPGNTCLAALNSGIKGSIEEPLNNKSKGCGGVMRVAPLGMFYDFDDELMIHEGAEIAAITHSHSLGYIPAGMLADIIMNIVHRRNRKTLNEIINEALYNTVKVFKKEKHIGYFEDLIKKSYRLAHDSNVSDIDAIKQLGEGWVAEETLAIAIYCALRYQDDFDKAIIASVNHSGDSDSTGSVCGNIIGAWLGYENINSKWLEKLELKEVILEMAEDLISGCPMGEYSSYQDKKWLNKYVDISDRSD